MNRRSFLSSCLALAAAPAIVRADSLMRIVPRDRLVLEPCELSDGWIRGYLGDGECKWFRSEGGFWIPTGNSEWTVTNSTDENTSQIDLIPSIVAKLR